MVLGGILQAGTGILGSILGAKEGAKIPGATTRQGQQNLATIESEQQDALRERLNALRGSFAQTENRLLPTVNRDIDRAAFRIDQAGAQIRSQRGALDNLTGDIRRSALANTSNARFNALSAARRTGSSRGGAFGLASSALGARVGQQAASQQAAGLTNALLQGRTATAQFDLQQSQLEAQNAAQRQGIAQLRLSGAGLAESRLQRLFSLDITGLQAQQNLAQGLQAGVSGLLGANINAAGNIGNTLANGLVNLGTNFAQQGLNSITGGSTPGGSTPGGGGGVGGGDIGSLLGGSGIGGGGGALSGVLAGGVPIA